MLARMPIARQFMLGFGIISLITLIEAAVVWSSVNSMDNALRRTSEKLLPQVERIGELEVTIIRASLETRHAMLMRTPAERDATLAEIGRLVKRANELIAEVERDLSTDEGRRRLEAVKRGKEVFLAAAGQIIPLIVAGQTDPALDMLVAKVIPARNEFLKAINNQRDWQEQLLKQSNAEALARGSRTEWLVLIVALLTAALGVALAIGFSRYLNRVLGGEPREAMKSVRAIASGDLTHQVPVRAGDTRSMMAELAAMRQGLTELVGSVREGVQSVATASSEIASGNADLSARTEQQAANVEHTVSAMTEITQSVRTSSDNARQANQMAAAASAAAQEGGEVVGRVVSTMGEIQAGSRRIGDITGTIDGIAFQTNILALNAAVEAARAGEAGRGFAVVAAEVRALAQRSAEAAREIKALISDSVGKIDEGDQLVKDAGQRMDQIVEQVRKVSNLLGEMSTASDEQTRGIDSVSEAVAQIDQGTQQNAALVEQSAAAADSLKQNAEQLAQTVAVFRIA